MTYIENKRDLVNYFFEGSKFKDNLRIGTEHEKFLFELKNKNSIPYNGDVSILKIFSELIKNNWNPIKEGKNILGLVKDKKNITLEPGLQFELSSPFLPTLGIYFLIISYLFFGDLKTSLNFTMGANFTTRCI